MGRSEGTCFFFARSFFWHKSLIARDGAGDMPAAMGVEDALLKGPKVRASFLERAWAWIHATFPERQIYIRSDGRVQFFTFGPSSFLT